jgi:hypothetical protein
VVLWRVATRSLESAAEREGDGETGRGGGRAGGLNTPSVAGRRERERVKGREGEGTGTGRGAKAEERVRRPRDREARRER